MSKKFSGLALLSTAAVSLAAVSSAAAIPVTSLTGDFSASNSTVVKTPDGVQFGPYFNGDPGGTLSFNGQNGIKLSDISDFGYTFNYKADGESPGNGGYYTAAPFARIFLDENGDDLVDHDIVLDPGDCTQNPLIAKNTDLNYQMVGYQRLRYDDDACDSLASQTSWADVVAAHGDQKVVGLKVSVGWIGTNVTALLRNISVNGVVYDFNSPPPGGANGINGGAGANGAPGAAAVSAASAVILNPVGIGAAKTRGNKIKVKIRCPKASGICDGNLRLVKGSRTISRAPFTIDGGKSEVVSLKVKPAFKKSAFKLVAFSRDEVGTGAKTTKAFSAKVG
jgi:hypothetical protein